MATRADLNNNPTNIKVPSGGLAVAAQRYNDPNISVDPNPATDGGQFLKFSSPELGHQATSTLLKDPIYQDKTVADAMKTWSGGGYGGDIAPDLADKPVSQLSPDELNKLTTNMAKREGYTGQLPTSSKGKLTREQLTANIDAMEKQGAKPEEVQSYLDSLKNDTQSPKFALKSESETQPAQSPDVHTGFLGTNPKDDLYGKAIDNSVTRGIMNFGNFMTGGGASQLGDVNSSVKDKLIGLGKTGASIAGLAAGGEALSGISGLLKGGSALASEPVTAALTRYAGKEAISTLSNAEKVNALTDSLSTAEPAMKSIISKAISELVPKVLKDAGVGSFSELHPAMAKILGLGGKALKFLLRSGLDVAGIKGLSMLK